MTIIEPAWQRSITVRCDRVRLRNHIRDGGSLTLVLADNYDCLEGMELRKLVLWMPHVGPRKADQLLRGLPAGYKLGMLNRVQHAKLVERIRRTELNLLARQLRR
jgi:hypothetical protein